MVLCVMTEKKIVICCHERKFKTNYKVALVLLGINFEVLIWNNKKSVSVSLFSVSDL